MSKLKNIIKQLSIKDYQAIYDSLMNSNAEKSAYLLKFLRDRQLSDTKIMTELEVNSNAYYTLRSRLNQKIEEYLLQQMESPRTSLIKKVATVSDIIFTKKRTIAVTTLKKLEKELVDYDLSNELTIVYKSLKRLLINSPEDHFTYSQLYNKHVAYTLALDKSEDLLANYSNKYGEFLFSHDETLKLSLGLLRDELINVTKLYESHRLYVYASFVNIWHHLFVDPDFVPEENIEQTFEKIQSIFDQYYLDATYYHLIMVLEYLRFEYDFRTGDISKAGKYAEDQSESTATLISNYQSYAFTPQFLLTYLNYNLANNKAGELYDQLKGMFEDYEVNKSNIPEYLLISVYKALACYYAGRYEEAAKLINTLLNDVSLKRLPLAHMEVKLLLALQYASSKETDLYNQLMSSVQRQVRLIGKEKCVHVILFNKIMKAIMSGDRRELTSKLNMLSGKLEDALPAYFTPLRYLKLKDTVPSLAK
jgi:hypothetical protein